MSKKEKARQRNARERELHDVGLNMFFHPRVAEGFYFAAEFVLN